MEILNVPLVEYGVARFTLPGHEESGDHHLVCINQSGILVAAIDGVGHGVEASNAAKAALSILKAGADQPIIFLVEQCHEKLRMTRGVVFSLASVDTSHGLLTWLGIGNVQGVLMRANSKKGNNRESLLLRGGVVGSQLPPMQATVLPVHRGDTLVFATDGVQSEFLENLRALEAPQRAADRILQDFRSGNDDAMVLVVRFTGVPL